MGRLTPLAAKRGYAPDVVVTPDEVPAGRPAPYMCYLNAIRLRRYPLDRMVKVGDTVVDVLEGRAAGMWTVATLLGGNEVGLSQAAEAALGDSERAARLSAARVRLVKAGAHYVLDSIRELPAVLDVIEGRLQSGEHAVGRTPVEE
jgi:phosphonoacetaldehyde hydrolase